MNRWLPTLRDALLAATDGEGLRGDARFNRLVESATALPFHRDDDGLLRPEFARLFTKFRIGPTMVVTSAGAHEVVQCRSCHDGDEGAAVARGLLERMREVTGLAARAERTLLTARRGGIEVGPALLDVGSAVDAQIELEASVHAFALDSGGAVAVAHARGVAAATRAQEAGRAALVELDWRRRALVVVLVLVGIVLLALALEIRSLPVEA